MEEITALNCIYENLQNNTERPVFPDRGRPVFSARLLDSPDLQNGSLRSNLHNTLPSEQKVKKKSNRFPTQETTATAKTLTFLLHAFRSKIISIPYAGGTPSQISK
jgi:hypothetical protein